MSSQNSQTGEVVSQNRQSEEGIEEVIIMLYDGYYDQNELQIKCSIYAKNIEEMLQCTNVDSLDDCLSLNY